MASETGESRGQSWGQSWGHLPAEQYLLQHWNRDVGQTSLEQYQQLVREFLAAGAIIAEPGPDDLDEPQQRIEASEDQINQILKPWRSEKLRNIAGALKNQRSDEVVVLRTHYSDDPAEKEFMEQIMLENEDCDPSYDEEHVWWQFLDDRAAFNFGQHWEHVYDTLPELTLRGVGKKSLLSSDRFTEAVSYETEYGHDPHVTVQEWARLSAHPLAIVDQETFTTSKLKLLFIDAVGNIVRSTRVETSELGIYRMTSFRAAIGDWSVWQEAEIGEKYQPAGAIGRVLRQKVEEVRVV